MYGSTWYGMVTKLMDQQKLFKEAKAAETDFWKAASVNDGATKLKSGGPFWYMVDRGLSASKHHEGTMVERIDLSTWITMSIGRAVDAIQNSLSDGMAVVATMGSTATVVRLFRPAWGFYPAPTALAMPGQASFA